MIIGAMALIGVLIGSFYLRSILIENKEAKSLRADSEQLQIVKTSINDEYNRCAAFLLQEGGGFAEFEYCKQFVSWVDKAF
jgi:hypothetical protein